MALCAVFEMEDGSVRLRIASPAMRRDRETELAHARRDATEQQEGITGGAPDLQGRPFRVVDSDSLPTDRATRADWRLKDGQVVVIEQPAEEKEAA